MLPAARRLAPLPMPQSALPWLVAALLALVAGWQSVRLAWLARRPGARARARTRRARRGERDAEALLRRLGYRLLERQPQARWDIEVDGRARTVELRADLVVARRGRRLIAEVKTGRLAPRLDHPATRRQLLEYRLAFGVDGVLLVDMEHGRVHEVRFPGRAPGGNAAWPWLLAGLAAGAAAAWWWLR